MRQRTAWILVTGAIASVALARQGIGQGPRSAEAMPMLYRPKAIKWKDGPPSLPKGSQFAVLEGDPKQDGPFTMRVKMPDGYRVPPHTHPTTERLTVISGTFRLGMGDTYDVSKMEDLPAGTYGYWPAGMKHYGGAKGEVVIQLHGTGPWQIHYLNPADDPRKEETAGRKEPSR